MTNFHFTAAERFLKYVTVDTQSDPNSMTHPSTEKQKDLGKILVEELLAMGIEDAHIDEFSYVYATIPSNTTKKVPVICFCAHMDTAPDASGTNVKPIVHKNYNGSDIVLPDDPTQIVSSSRYPFLKEKIGEDIITASGLTLLGSDDKAGVAEIMDAAYQLMNNPDIKHGKIRLLFTPDEEVGRGVDKIDMEKLGAEFGYTLDGGKPGSLEDETFSADGVSIEIKGVPIHPGYAKDKMENAIKVAADIIARLPKYHLSPETTEGKQGFVHPTAVNGLLESATVKFIVRDFTDEKLAQHHALLKQITEEVLLHYPGSTATFTVTEQYRNMKKILDKHPEVAAYAHEAISRIGLEPKKDSIRGGTDGSRLSFMGLPCPNIFAGEQAIHSKHEWVSIQDMNKAVEMIINISMIWEEKAA
ncbi:MAG: tripeptide aminopeptidase [Polaribacter sp.]|jgi:tripeptide aminopeptidase